MRNKVLIVALNTHWTGISRLPYGLLRANLEPFALCPKSSYLAKTKYLKKSIRFPTFSYSRSKIIYLWIAFSILFFKPDVVIPGDEDALLALQNVGKLFAFVPFFGGVSTLIRKSLAPQKFDRLFLSKSEFQEKCKEWGIRTPKNYVVKNSDEAIKKASEMGYPVVLKTDSGYGGTGVFICENKDELRSNLQKIEKVSLFAIIKSYCKKMFFASAVNNESGISIQQYIHGITGQSPFCAENGEVFAVNPMLKKETYPGRTGPASVSEGYDNNEIEDYVNKVVRELSFTGFASLEYIVDEKSGLPYIIELNPRPTPTSHFDSQMAVYDLCECFYKGMNGMKIEKKEFRPYTIAMYPGEKRRDPNSPYLTSGYQDVPLHDPELFAAIEAHS
jgi:predicted ATP-grasp superfamily ATP-dependent carboligase